MDLQLANRQLHPYKLWYVELEFDIQAADWTELTEGQNRWLVTLNSEKIDEGVKTPVPVMAEVGSVAGQFEEVTDQAGVMHRI